MGTRAKTSESSPVSKGCPQAETTESAPVPRVPGAEMTGARRTGTLNIRNTHFGVAVFGGSTVQEERHQRRVVAGCAASWALFLHGFAAAAAEL